MKTQAATIDHTRQCTTQRSSPDSFRIGIVGCGPRGLHCLQSLAEVIRQHRPTATLEVKIFEPASYPGAGNIYDPRQPNYLRMNFAAKHISAWPQEQVDTDRPTLVDWLNRGPKSASAAIGPHDFVSRAQVGEYLHGCYQRVVAELERDAHVQVIRAGVSTVRANHHGQWEVHAGGEDIACDELMVTVGHEGWRPSPSSVGSSPFAFIPTFPIEQNLQPDTIPQGTCVAIRGFGLTWIDAALALTEGRGGEFVQNKSTWRYFASGNEPRRMVPFSRTGRPMLAKPDESLFPQPSRLEIFWSEGRATIDALSQPVGEAEWVHTIWYALKEAAAKAVSSFFTGSGHRVSAADVQAWFDRWCQRTLDAKETLALLRQSHAVATRNASPDIAWALGAAWRNLYPAIARCVSHGGLAAEAWPRFHQVAVEMERIAFGPPAENVGRTLALVDAGMVDLRFLRSRLSTGALADGNVCTISNGVDTLRVDRGIDAVLPSPRQLNPTGPIHSLLAAGTIQRLYGVEGIHVDRTGRPRNLPAGMQGLAILGRVTEGCILGNDTLSRTLHDHPRRWALSVMRRLQHAEADR